MHLTISKTPRIGYRAHKFAYVGYECGCRKVGVSIASRRTRKQSERDGGGRCEREGDMPDPSFVRRCRLQKCVSRFLHN